MSVNEYTRQKMIIIIICFNLQYTRYFRQSAINVGQSHSLSVIESVKMLVLGYPVSSIVGFYNERQFSGWTVGDGRFQADCEREKDSIPQTFNNNETGGQLF